MTLRDLMTGAPDEDLLRMWDEIEHGDERGVKLKESLVYAYTIRWWGVPDASNSLTGEISNSLLSEVVSEVRREAAVRSLFASAPGLSS